MLSATSPAPAPSYGTADATASSVRPRLVRSATSLTPTTTLRQSSSIRALFQLTSTIGGDPVAPVPTPKAAPLQPRRSLRGLRRASSERVPLLRRSLTTTQLPPLVRAMSSVLGLPVPKEIEKFQCHICFDDAVPVTDAMTLSTCGHRYCSACFQSYLEIKIREGNVYPVCFHPMTDADHKTCGVAVDSQQIEALVAPEVWKKFNLFRFNKEHEHARECPHCGVSQDCVGPEKPECVCVQCSKTFCFFHDLAHDGRSCADYELENAETESVNRAKIKEIAKPCPGCKRDVEKDGGCNHMKCVVCQTSFCWLCGEIIEDVPMPSHFSATSESSCSGKQFDGDEQIELPWQLRVYAIVVAMLCFPVAFALAIVLTPITWCRSSSTENTFVEMFWFNHTIAMIWLALVVSLVFFVVAVVAELAFRVVVFVVMLPFVIIKTIAMKAVSCCRPRRESTQATVEVDLEAGQPVETISPQKERGTAQAVAA